MSEKITFLRTPQYDNTEARRKITPSWLTWAWGMRGDDREKILKTYPEVEWEEVDTNGHFVYAIDYEAVNEVICSDEREEEEDFVMSYEEEDDPHEKLKLIPFSEEHCVRAVARPLFDELSDGSYQKIGETYGVKTPYAALISPIPLKEDAISEFLSVGDSIEDLWVRDLVKEVE
jgi:hypothetical protein